MLASEATAGLSEFRSVFVASNVFDLLSRELFWRHTGRIAGFAKEAVQSSRRDHPEYEKFVIGIQKLMPRVFGNEHRSALLKRATYIVQNENSAAFQNV